MTASSKRSHAWLTAAVVTFCIAVGSTSACAADSERIRVGVTHTPGAGPLFIAAERYFASKGLDVRIEFLPSDMLVATRVASGELDAASGWDSDRWADAIDACFDVHDTVGTGGDARGPSMIAITEGPTEWTVRQILDDPAGDHDWGISAVVDLAASAEAGVAVVRVTDVGML